MGVKIYYKRSHNNRRPGKRLINDREGGLDGP